MPVIPCLFPFPRRDRTGIEDAQVAQIHLTMHPTDSSPRIWPLPKNRHDGLVRIIVVLVFLLGAFGLVQYLVMGVGSTTPPPGAPVITAGP